LQRLHARNDSVSSRTPNTVPPDVQAALDAQFLAEIDIQDADFQAYLDTIDVSNAHVAVEPWQVGVTTTAPIRGVARMPTSAMEAIQQMRAAQDAHNRRRLNL